MEVVSSSPDGMGPEASEADARRALRKIQREIYRPFRRAFGSLRKIKREIYRFPRAREALRRRTLRLIVEHDWTSLPPVLRRSDFLRLGLASHLLRRAELGDAPKYFRAAELLSGCRPSSFFDVSEDRLQSHLDCLAALGERDLILAIADLFVRASIRDPNPRRLLLLAGACVAVNAKERASALLSSQEPRSRGADPIGKVAGIYPVRELFPPHWARRDEAGLVTVRKPGVMGRPSEHGVTLPLPFQDCAAIERARVFGEFNIIDADDRLVIYDHAGHPRLPHVAGQRLEIRGAALAMDRAAVYCAYARRERLPAAVHIAGRCAANYFHWMIEYLPRLLTAIEGNVDREAKLLIPANMARSMRQALDIVNASRFPVHEVAKNTLLEVDRLFVPSMHSCIVDGGALPLSRISALSWRHLRFVRERILSHVQKRGDSAPLPRKVFLLRGTRARNLCNEDRIRAVLADEGFVAVDPTRLHFKDQVRLFRDAKAIVAASGAALSNLLFCENEPDVLALVGRHILDFNMYSNVLQIAGGGRFSHVPGRPLISPSDAVTEEHYIHVDYAVRVEDVLESLRYMRSQN